MATSREANCRLQLQRIIGTVIDPNRIILGLDDFPANVDFFANLAPQGPFVVIMPAKQGDWNAQNRHYKIHVEIRLYFSIPADKSYDFTAVEDIWYGGVFQAVTAIANWNTAANTAKIPPPDVPYSDDGPSVDPKRKPLPGLYVNTFSFWGNTAS
jgi:hypothetical protein